VKSILFQFILICLLSITSFGQEISKEEIIKFKIKSITTIDSDGKIESVKFYNDKGNFTKKSSSSEENKLHLEEEFFYNDSSQIVEKRKYDYKGEINTTTKYFYNKKRQLIKTELGNSRDIDATWTYEYDEKGNKLTEMQKSGTMGNSITKYKYNTNNLLVQQDTSNDTIGKEETITYQYSPKNQLIEKKTKAYYFNTTITLTYSYNEMGKLIKLIEKSSNGVSSIKDYSYDDKGLLINDIWKSSLSKMTHKTTYKISF
jgi:hypothetical protein